MKKNIFYSALVLLLSANQAAAQDEAWLPQAELTPTRLSTTGAVLTGTDSMAWPDGRAVFVTYWLGAGDAVFRCAELRDAEAPNSSCWRREIVEESGVAPGMRVVRRVSTRRRPRPYLNPYQSPYALNPHVWVGVRR